MQAPNEIAFRTMGYIAAEYWPAIVAVAILLIAVSGVCSLLFTAKRVHGADDGNVVNFEKWRG